MLTTEKGLLWQRFSIIFDIFLKEVLQINNFAALLYA